MNKRFGALLSEGISSIAHRWHKTRLAVCRDLTQQLREAGFNLTDSTVGGWCRGFVPQNAELVAWTVRYCMQRGRIDQHWVESILSQAQYPEKSVLLAQLFPAGTELSNSGVSLEVQRLPYVDDLAITLRTPLGSSFIGRKELLAALKQHLIARENQGKLALIGLPGVGKTTLALELALSQEVREAFRDGILYVNLGSQPNIEYHLERWAKLLGLATEGMKLTDRQDAIEAIHASIGKRQILLVIEDAWTIDAALVFQIGGPQCAHLLTTRFSDIALHFADQGVVKVTELNEDESKQLLARFIPQVVKDEPEQVQALIRSVDGLPLALTLIGKHLQLHAFHRQPRRIHQKLLTLQQVTERLRLKCPPEPLSVTRSPAHSLIASIDASYEALSRPAQRAFRALCVFPAKPGNFSEEAGLVVSTSTSAVIDELTDAGLLESDPAGRYTIHQTIADYGSLKKRGLQVEKRLVEFFVDYVGVHTNDYNLLDQEASNIMYALSLAVAGKMLKWVMRGVQAFFSFLLLRGWYETAIRYCQQELEAVRELADQQGICTALIHLGTLNAECGNFTQAEVYTQEGLELAHQIQHSQSICTLLRLQGSIASKRGDHMLAEAYAQEGLARARQIDDKELICWHILLLGITASHKGENDRAEIFLQEGLCLALQIEQYRATNGFLTALGTLASMRGDYTQAEKYYQEGLELAESNKNIERVAAFLQGLGMVAGMRCDYARAEKCFEEALPLVEAMQLRTHQINLAINLAIVAQHRGKSAQAETHFLKALALSREIGYKDICSILTGLGVLYSKQRDLERSLVYLEESVTLAREIEHYYYQCEALLALIFCSIKQENWQKARAHLEEMFVLMKNSSNEQFRSQFLNGWGEYYLGCGQSAAAVASFQEALDLARKIEEKPAIAQALYGLARIARLRGNNTEARLHGHASARIFAATDVESAHEVNQWLLQLECDSDVKGSLNRFERY